MVRSCNTNNGETLLQSLIFFTSYLQLITNYLNASNYFIFVDIANFERILFTNCRVFFTFYICVKGWFQILLKIEVVICWNPIYCHYLLWRAQIAQGKLHGFSLLQCHLKLSHILKSLHIFLYNCKKIQFTNSFKPKVLVLKYL